MKKIVVPTVGSVKIFTQTTTTTKLTYQLRSSYVMNVGHIINQKKNNYEKTNFNFSDINIVYLKFPK